jgi:hypothetical protein
MGLDLGVMHGAVAWLVLRVDLSSARWNRRRDFVGNLSHPCAEGRQLCSGLVDGAGARLDVPV